LVPPKLGKAGRGTDFPEFAAAKWLMPSLIEPDSRTLRTLSVLGLRIGDKKNLGPLRTNLVAQYHALLARTQDAAPGQWQDLGVWTTVVFV
jgi:hypothetical protein